MVRCSHKRRKRFPCGHSGYGRGYHRCGIPRRPIGVDLRQPSAPSSKIAGDRSRKRVRQWATRQRWQASCLADPIPLRHLPKPVVLKTRRILAALEQGTAPAALHGKRFQFDRTLLRIPLSYRYRLLCRWQQDRILLLMVLSHAAYNAVARSKRRLGEASIQAETT